MINCYLIWGKIENPKEKNAECMALNISNYIIGAQEISCLLFFFTFHRNLDLFEAHTIVACLKLHNSNISYVASLHFIGLFLL